MDGIIVINKEKGYTSFDVVAKMRGILKTKKIGHTGTLDPEAEGVLPVCVGKATGLCALLTDTDKEYEAVMVLGKVSDTQDITGEILNECEINVSEEEVKEAIASFRGVYEQIPPMFSALKVDGKKLCDLARKGIEVERQARNIEIYEIEIRDIKLPKVTMRVRCSKGTYIRTLCHDIGQKLRCGALMEALVRTKAAGFGIQEAITLTELETLRDEDKLSFVLKPIDSFFNEYRVLRLLDEYKKFGDNGNQLMTTFFTETVHAKPGEIFRVYSEKSMFYGIYEERNGVLHPKKMFFCESNIEV